MPMHREYIVNRQEEYKEVFRDILQYFRAEQRESLVIALRGDLGAGKTTFTQEFGRYVGVTEPITSPTFTIMKQYELEHELFDVLIHIDAYRLESEEEAKPIRLKEVFSTPRAIICVEWPERIPSYIPKAAILITLSITDSEKRFVEVIYPDESGRAE